MDDGLIIPALVLALIGWLVPKGLSLIWAEGVRPLLALALCATVIMFVIGTGFFLTLYWLQGVPLAVIFEPGLVAGLLHFGRLGLISALLWGPILVLSVAGVPKGWVRETW